MKKLFLSIVAIISLSFMNGCASDRYSPEAAVAKVNEFIAEQEQETEQEQESIYSLATIYWDLKNSLENSRAVDNLCQCYNDLYFARKAGYSLLNMTEVKVNDDTTEWYYNYNDSCTLKCTDEAGYISVEAYHWDKNTLSEEDIESLFEKLCEEAASLFGDDVIVDIENQILEFDGKILTFDVFENNMIKVTLG